MALLENGKCKQGICPASRVRGWGISTNYAREASVCIVYSSSYQELQQAILHILCIKAARFFELILRWSSFDTGR